MLRPGFPFAEEHSKIKKWPDPRATHHLKKGQGLPLNAPSAKNQDVLWRKQRPVPTLSLPPPADHSTRCFRHAGLLHGSIRSVGRRFLFGGEEVGGVTVGLLGGEFAARRHGSFGVTTERFRRV